MTIAEVRDRSEWDQEVESLGGHPLQLWGWGEVKRHGSWRPRRLRVAGADGAVLGLAQVLVRPLPAQFKALSYVPRGPVVVGDATGETDPQVRTAVLRGVVDWCRAEVGGVGITLEPDWPAETGLDIDGGRPAANHMLIPQTLILDLRRSTDELMAAMSKSTRYYVRKSQRDALEYRAVSTDAELAACLDIYRTTAERAGFGIHDDDYYRLVRTELGEHSPVFAAFAQSTDDGPHDRPVAFVWLAASGRTAFELYAGMDEDGAKQRANYGLKWCAITTMRDRGVTRYDMNGLLNDGISAFKRGFSGHEDALVGSVDVPFSMWYGAWNKGLPTAKRIMRRVRGAR